jgi:hypothetical protein
MPETAIGFVPEVRRINQLYWQVLHPRLLGLGWWYIFSS